MFLKMQERLDRMNTILQENLAGIRVVKAFVRTAHEITRFDHANQELMAQAVKVSELAAVFMPLMHLVLNLALVGAIWLGSGSVQSGDMSLGHMVAAINYLGFSLFPVPFAGGHARSPGRSRCLGRKDSGGAGCSARGQTAAVSGRPGGF